MDAFGFIAVQRSLDVDAVLLANALMNSVGNVVLAPDVVPAERAIDVVESVGHVDVDIRCLLALALEMLDGLLHANVLTDLAHVVGVLVAKIEHGRADLLEDVDEQQEGRRIPTWSAVRWHVSIEKRRCNEYCNSNAGDNACAVREGVEVAIAFCHDLVFSLTNAATFHQQLKVGTKGIHTGEVLRARGHSS